MEINTFKKLNGEGKKIAIVQAHFNEGITNKMRDGAIKALKESGVNDKDIEVFVVPGSVEIPIVCQKVARKKKFDGIITIGTIIKGETAHFDYVAKAITDGFMRVSLDEGLPITFGVITTYNLEQAQARAKDDENNKGYEAGMALVEVLSLSV
ncbi:6,7-dimethyl-8-ribityllumazine synthase [Candidatus Falkowbacteria bacterium]|jgi:6,7-dimethyl-8-ribityllumazine synthase|nr:6,7-dimethyl-8-ribityllumazine synthase [Candidatus Falkowbacteria bacterium]MBT4433391.1 6,7-dimethyl-8-ribityllumazine synthase [Candidatus Falkowbacteria bacterium]